MTAKAKEKNRSTAFYNNIAICWGIAVMTLPALPIAAADKTEPEPVVSDVAPTERTDEIADERVDSPPETSPCATVTCSNQGTCIVKSGQAMCACNDGYAADQQTGQTCEKIAQAPQATVAAPPPPLPTSSPQEISRVAPEVAPLIYLLPGYNFESAFVTYQQVNFDGTFYDYVEHRFKKRRKVGIALLTAGASLFTAAIVCVALDGAGYGKSETVTVNEGEADVDSYGKFELAGIIASGIGTPLLVVGLVMTIRYNKRLRRIAPAKPAPTARATRIRVSPFALGGMQLQLHF